MPFSRTLLALLGLITLLFASTAGAVGGTGADLVTRSTSEWQTGYCYSFIVKNPTSEKIISWKIGATLSSSVSVTASWGGKFAREGERLSITPESWNTEILAGSQTEIGYCASGTVQPSGASVDSTFLSSSSVTPGSLAALKDVSLSRDGLSVTWKSSSSWQTGYCRVVTVKNTTSSILSDWSLSFSLSQDITPWSADYRRSGNIYTVTPLEWNKRLLPGAQTEIGYCTTGNMSDTDQSIVSAGIASSPTPTPPTPPTSPTPPPTTPTPPPNSGTQVTLPPSPPSGTQISYPAQAWENKKVDSDGDGKTDTIMSLNPWNIASAAGTAQMYFDTEGFHYKQNLSSIRIKDGGGYILSYPELFVGNKPWGQYVESPSLLPEQVSKIKNLVLNLSYTLQSQNQNLPMNFALDMWVTKNKFQSSGVGNGEVEIMFWMYANGLNPVGSKIGETEIPLLIDGEQRKEIFEIWRGNIGWEVISLRPKNGGWLQARIDLDLRNVIDVVRSQTTVSGFDTLYLEDVEVGAESGSPSTTAAAYSWDIPLFRVKGTLTSDASVTPSPVTPLPVPPVTPVPQTQTGALPNKGKFVAYYPTWAQWDYPYTSVDYTKFDIINHAFIFPNADGSLSVPPNTLYPELVKATHNHGKKITISLFGGTDPNVFATVLLDPIKRARFLREIKKFVINNGYDGVDIDWEFPQSTQEADALIAFFSSLRKTLGTGKIISIALAVQPGYVDVEKLSKVVDFIYLMDYDLEGGWNGYAGYNSPLYKNAKMSYDMSIEGFLGRHFFGKNIDMKKIILGFPLYGRKFAVSTPYMPAWSSDAVLYKDLPSTGCQDNWDSESHSPYLTCGSYYISYDDLRTLRERYAYAEKSGFGGLFVWALGQDNGKIVSYFPSR